MEETEGAIYCAKGTLLTNCHQFYYGKRQLVCQLQWKISIQ